ncbi:nuclear transport factor 2 family protein [bacterium]|nr:nuclear transport factor 2 family protein [bacterium]
MSINSTVDIAVKFIECINRRNFDGLGELMSPAHRLVSDSGEIKEGQELSLKTLRDYTCRWPDFQIHIGEIFMNDEYIIIVARTTGSCDQKPPSEEIRQRRLYRLLIRDGKTREFQYAMEDNNQRREEFRITADKRITT